LQRAQELERLEDKAEAEKLAGLERVQAQEQQEFENVMETRDVESRRIQARASAARAAKAGSGAAETKQQLRRQPVNAATNIALAKEQSALVQHEIDQFQRIGGEALEAAMAELGIDKDKMSPKEFQDKRLQELRDLKRQADLEASRASKELRAGLLDPNVSANELNTAFSLLTEDGLQETSILCVVLISMVRRTATKPRATPQIKRSEARRTFLMNCPQSV
jgi:hypothetical protein